MSYLIYVNGLGPNFKGDNIYEFIFSDEQEVWGEGWDSKPCNGYPFPPELKYIKKVGVLRDTDVKLELIQNSDYFSMVDAVDGVVALDWEQDDTVKSPRMVFKFNDEEQKIKDLLYEKDLILEFEKKVVYEK
jgi:hypothetical protein